MSKINKINPSLKETHSRSKYARARLSLVIATLGLFVLPAAAGAADRYVDPSGSNAANDCLVEAVPCLTIQHTIDQTVNGDRVLIADGTYFEQARIDAKTIDLIGESRAGSIIKMAPGSVYGPNDLGFNWSLIRIINASTVSIDNLTVAGPGMGCGTPGTPGSPALLNYGVLVEDSSEVDVSNTTVRDVRDEPIGGCQHGHALLFRSGSTGSLSNVDLIDYQKSGLIVSGAGSSVLANDLLVDAAVDPPLAQNGIQVSSGADLILTNSIVRDNRCGYVTCGIDPWFSTTSNGILTFAAGNVDISDSTFTNNDVGIFNYGTATGAVENNTFANNRGVGVVFAGGSTLFRNNQIVDNPIGIYLMDFSGQISPTSDTINSNNILGNGEGIVLANDNLMPSSATLTGNRIYTNAVGMAQRAGALASSFPNNWWGCNAGPNNLGCDSNIAANANTNPRLQISMMLAGTGLGGSSVPLTTNMDTNSTGQNVSALARIPDGIPVAFVSDFGVPSPASFPTANGYTGISLELPLDPSTPGPAVTAEATLDSQTVSASIGLVFAPVNTVPLNIAKNGNIISSSGSIFTGSAPMNFGTQWYSCDLDGLNCLALPGETGSDFDISALPNNFSGKIKAIITASNAYGSDDSESNEITVTPPPVNQPPVNIVAPVVSQAGQTLTVGNDGIWTGTSPIGFAYQWYSCDLGGLNCLALLEETGASFDLNSLPSNFAGQIKLVISASNDYGSADADSNSFVIEPLPPAGKAPKNMTPPVVTQRNGVFTVANNGVWSGNKPMTFSYSWSRCNRQGKNCRVIAGAKGKSFNSNQLDKNFRGRVKVEVLAKNSFGDAGAATRAESRFRLINTRLPRVIPAVDGYSVFAEVGDWYGRGRVETKTSWQICDGRGNLCRSLGKHRSRLRIVGREWAGKTVRLHVVASNRDGRVLRVSRPQRISSNDLAENNINGRCSRDGGQLIFRIGVAGERISSARVQFGSKIVNPRRQGASFRFYRLRLPESLQTRRVIRARWASGENLKVYSQTVAFLTCR